VDRARGDVGRARYRAAMVETIVAPGRTGDAELRVLPANEVSWGDLQTVMGRRGDASRCQCQWFKIPASAWREASVDERAAALRRQTHCDDARATTTSGLVGYIDDEPAGWVAVEPRVEFPRLRGARVPWAGRAEQRDDPAVWAITCFVVRAGFRRQGVSRGLTRAAADHARAHGATAVEGYPMTATGAADPSAEELYVGTRSAFEAAGFTEVSRPTPRRVVMRLDF
jgi:GNAT superfamily N-acetyltransferase